MLLDNQGVLEGFETTPDDAAPQEPADLDVYERCVVMFSGGKDSIACFLHLLELGVPRERIELHHHLVDGVDEADRLMDWPVTDSYVKAFADAFGVKLTRSWKQGGFKGEMLRENAPTAPIVVELGDGTTVSSGGEGPIGTRLKFPQVSASLQTRYCSAYLKVMAADRWFIKDPRFLHSKTLVLTGERAEESAGRARYRRFEPDRADARGGRLGRWIDRWRPVHGWDEQQVWRVIARHKVNPHPAYRCGFSRASCLACIFGSPDQWATVAEMAPSQFETIAGFEKRFGITIHRERGVEQQCARGCAYDAEAGWREIAMSTTYTAPIIDPNWTKPIGAFGRSCGPT